MTTRDESESRACLQTSSFELTCCFVTTATTSEQAGERASGQAGGRTKESAEMTCKRSECARRNARRCSQPQPSSLQWRHQAWRTITALGRRRETRAAPLCPSSFLSNTQQMDEF